MSPLLNVWKFFEKLRKKHQRVQRQTFRQLSGIFENLRKSSEKIGKCRKVLKMTFQHFKTFYEIFGNHRKSSKVFVCLRKSSYVFENLRKISEICRKVLKLKKPSSIFHIFLNLRKLSEVLEIFGSFKKKSENVGKFSERPSDAF